MKSTDEIRTCPMCEEGQLALRTHTARIRHEDALLDVEGMEYCECPACGADPVLEDQIRRNELRIADAKRHFMGLLTGAEIKMVRDNLGLTQRQAADLFGGGTNSFSKYERGAVLQSAAMDMLLKLLALRPDLLSLVGLLKGKSLGECLMEYDWSERSSDAVLVSSPDNMASVLQRLPHSENTWSQAA